MDVNQSTRASALSATPQQLEHVNISALDVIVNAARKQFDPGQLRYLSEQFANLASKAEKDGERS